MKNFCLIFIFCFCFCGNIYAQNEKLGSNVQKNSNTKDSNLISQIYVTEIADVSHELEIVIERYVFNKRKINTKKCYQDGYIFIIISSYYYKQFMKKNVFDSLYSVNNFSNNPLLGKRIGGYKLLVNLINKNNMFFKDINTYYKLYYYPYKQYKVLITSDLPLQFVEIGTKKLYVLNNPYYKGNCKCDELNYTVDTYFEWGNAGIGEIRFKDLIRFDGGMQIDMIKK